MTQGVIDGTYSVMGGYKPKCPECGEKMDRTFDYDLDDTRIDFKFECPKCGHWYPTNG
jgi:hypothetical protein